MTSQRRLILETLSSASGHPTAEELFGLVQQNAPGIHLSTVYRTMRWLEQEGLVNARVFDQEQRQERFDLALPSEHHHFLCNSCKQVIEFDDPLVDEIKSNFEQASGSLVEMASVVFYGLCEDCQKTRQVTAW